MLCVGYSTRRGLVGPDGMGGIGPFGGYIARTGDLGVDGLRGLGGYCPCEDCRCLRFGAFVISLGGFFLEYSGGDPEGRSIGGGGNGGLVVFCCDLRSSCAITAAYSLSISCCRFCLSASTTAASKLITLAPAGEVGLLMPPLRMLLAELFFALSLRGEYQLRLLTGLIGLGSNALFIGFTSSVLLASAALLSAFLRRDLPTVKSRMPMMMMLPR